MTEGELSWKTALKALGLLAVLGFVFSVQYVPHMATFENPPAEEDDPGLLRLGVAWQEYATGDREGFPWAIHVDEHFHASMTFQVERHDRVVPWNAYAGDPGEFNPLGSLRGAVHERGYHIFLAQIGDVTGISTLSLYQFGPAFWTTLIAFGVYALLRPNPAAFPAAAFVALLPTSLRFLGTGFLVPIGVSLAWLPATAILTEPAKKRASAGALLLGVVTWAFFVHLIAGFAAVAAVLGAALFSSGRARRSALVLVLLATVPVLWLWRYFSAGIQDEIERGAGLPQDFTIFDNFGIITLGIWALGIALIWLVPPEDRDLRPEAASFTALSLVALGMIVSSVRFDLNRYAMYSRMHPIFFLTATVPIGFSLALVGRYCRNGLSRALDRIPAPSPGKRTAIATVVAIAVVLSAAVPATSQAVSYHVDEPYYRIMNDRAWNAVTAASENLSDREAYDVFLSNPWQAPFLFEKSGLSPHTVGSPGGTPANEEAWRDYLNRRDEASYYVMNDITVVIGSRKPAGDFWEEAADDVWVMEEPYAEQLNRIREGKDLQLDALPEG